MLTLLLKVVVTVVQEGFSFRRNWQIEVVTETTTIRISSSTSDENLDYPQKIKNMCKSLLQAGCTGNSAHTQMTTIYDLIRVRR